MEDGEKSRRIFDVAIYRIQQQPQHSIGSCVQLPAKKGRRSIFDRMDCGPGNLKIQSRHVEVNDDDNAIGRNGYRGGNGRNEELRKQRIGPYNHPQSRRQNRSSYDPGAYVSVRREGQLDHGRQGNREGAEEIWAHDLYDGPPVVTGSRVFVRNIPKTTTTNELIELFGRIGRVVAVNIDRGPLTTATVAFLRRETAELAQRELHGVHLGAMKIKVAAIDENRIEGRLVMKNGNENSEAIDGSAKEGLNFLPNTTPRKSVFDRLR